MEKICLRKISRENERGYVSIFIETMSIGSRTCKEQLRFVQFEHLSKLSGSFLMTHPRI